MVGRWSHPPINQPTSHPLTHQRPSPQTTTNHPLTTHAQGWATARNSSGRRPRSCRRWGRRSGCWGSGPRRGGRCRCGMAWLVFVTWFGVCEYISRCTHRSSDMVIDTHNQITKPNPKTQPNDQPTGRPRGPVRGRAEGGGLRGPILAGPEGRDPCGCSCTFVCGVGWWVVWRVVWLWVVNVYVRCQALLSDTHIPNDLPTITRSPHPLQHQPTRCGASPAGITTLL